MDTVATIFSIIFSILALAISFWTFRLERRKVIAAYAAANRQDWIKEVRKLMFDFAECYYKGKSKDKLRLLKTKIDLYIKKNDVAYKNFDDVLESCIIDDFNIETYNKLIEECQNVLNSAWRRLKAETGISSRTDKKYRQMFYDE